MSKFKKASPTGTAENPMVVLKRLLRYLKPYRLRLAVVFLCIIFCALASTISATFLKTLGIAERNVREVHTAIRNLQNRMFRIGQVALFV